ncbi:MAG TPA: GreA/GreB family elongation factor [Chthoniobacterales bacterium]|jgi:transcription elongation GreA/GreB family factor|nr:GreA/GreB family elongation factor [Chthoniobacterales bacterium]
MDAELQKLVDAGKLTTAGAETLERLKPGTFCLHKSWGFGRVADWNLLLNQILIDFEKKKAHPMQLQYAADNLTPIPAGHFLARKATDLAALKVELKENAAAVMRGILESLGGKATQAQISSWLLGDVFNEPEFKRWWDATKKLLKKEGHFLIPTKKNDPIELRDAPVSRSAELLTFFEQARQPKEQAAALDQIIKLHHEFEEPAKQLQPLLDTIEETARRNQRLNPALAFELVIGRDDLLEREPKLRSSNPDFNLERLIVEEEPRLADILPKLPSAKERRVLHALPAALGERWTVRALQLMQGSNARLVSAMPKVFAETGRQDELRAALDRSLREHSATSEILYWLCKNRTDWPDLINPELLSAILSACERDQHNESNSRSTRLRDLLLSDRSLIPDIFAGAELAQARDAMRRLMLSPVFDELTKRSLMARIIKLYPELQSLITGEQMEEKSEALVVSWSSLQKRKAELEELVNKKIPENSKEIGVARSYGDLRENFEFKAAKEMQAVLMRRKAELERDLHRARGTAFESPDLSQASMGTIVTLRETTNGREETYTILGAWDGDPDRGIISYQTAIGQSLLGRRLGEVVELNAEEDRGRYAIIAIEPAPLDEVAADPELLEPVASES